MSKSEEPAEGLTEVERRRVPRRAFGGVAEISTVDPVRYIIAPTTELSQFGCFVGTREALPAGTKVSVKITNDAAVFNASGELVYGLPTGMGIKFVAAAPEDEALLKAWLK